MKFKSRKAQFFILSAFAIVSIVYFMARWVEPFTIIDVSEVASLEEAFLFNNVKEKAIDVIKQSKSCDDLQYNLEEYKNFVEIYVIERGKLLLVYHLTSPCKLPSGEEIPTVVIFDLNLTSPRIKIGSHFYETWKPS
ncbi:MAG: hypothetical protein QMD14_02590 [Candidatus Aenigmarchaeota archaeon]|nr:hypothetical protein [Candidatus Aenigmarchaeota archaeon]